MNNKENALGFTFRDRDVISDNYDRAFRKPVNDEEYNRGYYY